jgi:hypothetical protein
LRTESVIGRLAIQFGRASGNRAALRDATGRMENGKWHRWQPDPAQFETTTMTPHARGALLVAAVFDAFLAIYNTRTADLVRLSTGGGSGIRPAGAIHPDLVHRLCEEASKSAQHVLTMIIRALDYLPPVDITFFEFLRAVITADLDLVPDDRLNYRVALIDAFRRRGIYPKDRSSETSAAGRTLSVETLRWRPPDPTRRPEHWKDIEGKYEKIAKYLKPYADENLYLKDAKSDSVERSIGSEPSNSSSATLLTKCPISHEKSASTQNTILKSRSCEVPCGSVLTAKTSRKC